MLAKINQFIEMINRTKHYLVIGLSQLIIVILAIWSYDFFLKPRIGVVNITGIADEFIKTQSKSNISPEELKKQVHMFAKSLEKGLQVIGVKKNAVLMPAEAVITGAKDYTQEVRRYLTKANLNIPIEKAN